MNSLPAESLNLLLGLTFFLASLLYAAVGHGGASAYLAVMGLCGMLPVDMKPTALVLNIAVSGVALGHFAMAGHFSHRLFWPLAAASVPAAFLGGWLDSPEPIYKIILAAALTAGALRLVTPHSEHQIERSAAIPVLLASGAGIGFLSGLVGIGGGIFLTPLLVIFRWAPAKTAAAVSAAFIAVNSCSGIGGFIAKGGQIPAMAWALLPCVVIGGWIGSCWGSGTATSPALRRSLAAVLVVAAAKFVMIQ